MKRSICIGLLAAAVAGCGAYGDDNGEWEVKPDRVVDGPADTLQVAEILAEFYQLSSVPEIYWYGGAALDCHDGRAFEVDKMGCLQSVTFHNRQIVLSDYWPLQTGFTGDSGLSHEMAHVASYQHGEGGDPGHTSHYFAPGGELDQAYDLLVSLGMATPGL